MSVKIKILYFIFLIQECGLVYVKPNARIIGGETAEPKSWPSLVLVEVMYKADVLIESSVINVDVAFLCAGSLIDRTTLVTAAHCIIRDFVYQFNDNLYTIPVEPNKYYPTVESMFKVYVGVFNMSSVDLNVLTSTTVFHSVKRVIVVG